MDNPSVNVSIEVALGARSGGWYNSPYLLLWKLEHEDYKLKGFWTAKWAEGQPRQLCGSLFSLSKDKRLGMLSSSPYGICLICIKLRVRLPALKNVMSLEVSFRFCWMYYLGVELDCMGLFSPFWTAKLAICRWALHFLIVSVWESVLAVASAPWKLRILWVWRIIFLRLWFLFR